MSYVQFSGEKRMHWVKATTPDGQPAWVNMAAVHTMMRVRDVTMLFIGGVATMTETVETDEGPQMTQRPLWAKTDVRETPAQLLNLPVIKHGQATEEPKPLPDAVTKPVVNARKVQHVAAKRKRAKV